MSLFSKPKKALSSILSTFTQAMSDLEEWEKLSAIEQTDMEERLRQLKTDQVQAAKARVALESIIGK